eukprot:6782634-Prymnesium_polylepis.1
MGSYLIDGEFKCSYSTQCGICGPRQDVMELRGGSSPNSFNGICNDMVMGGSAGYGTDTHDCGVMRVQRYA